MQKYARKNLFKTMLTLKEERVEAAKEGIENGAALRVLIDGAWGFASVGTFNLETLTSALSDACKMAKAASSKLKTPIKLVKGKAFEDKVLQNLAKTLHKFPIEDKIATTSAMAKTILSYDRRVKAAP
jgi:TldD protein